MTDGTETPEEPRVPDISEFKLSAIETKDLWHGTVELKRRSNRVFTQHTIGQMLAAVQTGAKIGFKTYDKPYANVIGGQKTSYGSYEESTYAEREEDGTEFLLLKVSYPTKITELVIQSVTVLERDRDGAPLDDNWEAIGSLKGGYLSGSHAFETWNEYKDSYKITKTTPNYGSKEPYVTLEYIERKKD